jgi:hypothetical protein
MIRTVLIPDKNHFSLSIPDFYIGKRVEVIAFALDESSEDIIYPANGNRSFSAISLKTKGFKFNRDEANER